MSLDTQLTILDLAVEDGRRAASSVPRISPTDYELSLPYHLGGEHRIPELGCPDWLLTASIRAGCRTVEDLVKAFILKASVWRVPVETAAHELLFAWNFYRDWDECERLAGEMIALLSITQPAAAPALMTRAARRRKAVGE